MLSGCDLLVILHLQGLVLAGADRSCFIIELSMRLRFPHNKGMTAV
jgi:hypothetical protein